VSTNSLLTLNHMADFLASHYNRTIAPTTPYWWWKMHKAAKLPVKMPEPVQNHGQSPLFDPHEIKVWYGNYLDAIDEPYDIVKSKKRARTKAKSQPRSKK